MIWPDDWHISSTISSGLSEISGTTYVSVVMGDGPQIARISYCFQHRRGFATLYRCGGVS